MRFSDICDQLQRDLGYSGATAAPEATANIRAAVNRHYRELAVKNRWSWTLARMVVAISAGQEHLSLPPHFSALRDLRNEDGGPVRVVPSLDQLRYQTRRTNMGILASAFAPAVRQTAYATGTISVLTGGTLVSLSGGTWPADALGRCITVAADAGLEPMIVTNRGSDSVVTIHSARAGATLAASAFAMDPSGTRRLTFSPTPSAAFDLHIYYTFVPEELSGDDDVPILPPEFHGYLIEAARVDLLHGIKERGQLWQQAVIARDQLLTELRRRDQPGPARLDRDGIGTFA
jgi:hypothetical protein